MKYLGYAYRFASNFAFLALVYFSLNFIGQYQQRTIIAALVLAYAAMRAVSALRTFYFFKSIERLELEARRLGGLSMEGPIAAASRKVIVKEVVELRQAGEMKSYIDLLFLGIIVVLCLAKIFSN
ncbi:UDP-3-O-acyl-N-acetylglucosamine deacetylase [Nitrobacteraceae bacterium AZCC 2161]|jgi:UDP-3-O-acyl-N-acetylglucosamine deacetylase